MILDPIKNSRYANVVVRSGYPSAVMRKATTPTTRKAPTHRKTLTAKERREMPYEDYLKTAYWAAKRRVAILRAKGRCQVCNSNISLQVHHRTYERRGCEHAADLTVLCKRCHERHHLPKEPK